MSIFNFEHVIAGWREAFNQVYFLINHKLTRVYVIYRHAKNLRLVSPQNRLTLKEFDTTTREIGLIIFHELCLYLHLHFGLTLHFHALHLQSCRNHVKEISESFKDSEE